MRNKRLIRSGDVFGRWTILSEVEPEEHIGYRYRMFLCKCICGKEKVKRMKTLSGPHVGCSNECRKPIVGRVINGHCVLKSEIVLYDSGWRQVKYRCECVDCGRSSLKTRYYIYNSGCVNCVKRQHKRERAAKRYELHDPAKVIEM